MLNVFDLLTILLILPVSEYIISRAFAAVDDRPRFPLTAFFPVFYFVVWFVGNLGDPYFLYKFTHFLTRLLNAEESFIYFIYAGFGLVLAQVAGGLWRHKIGVGK